MNDSFDKLLREVPQEKWNQWKMEKNWRNKQLDLSDAKVVLQITQAIANEKYHKIQVTKAANWVSEKVKIMIQGLDPKNGIIGYNDALGEFEDRKVRQLFQYPWLIRDEFVFQSIVNILSSNSHP